MRSAQHDVLGEQVGKSAGVAHHDGFERSSEDEASVEWHLFSGMSIVIRPALHPPWLEQQTHSTPRAARFTCC